MIHVPTVFIYPSTLIMSTCTGTYVNSGFARLTVDCLTDHVNTYKTISGSVFIPVCHSPQWESSETARPAVVWCCLQLWDKIFSLLSCYIWRTAVLYSFLIFCIDAVHVRSKWIEAAFKIQKVAASSTRAKFDLLYLQGIQLWPVLHWAHVSVNNTLHFVTNLLGVCCSQKHLKKSRLFYLFLLFSDPLFFFFF